MTETVKTNGHCAPQFEPMREVFLECFSSGDEVGAALAVTIDGKPVVNLWGGWADQENQKPWQEDTLVCVASTTKGPTAMCALRLMEEEKLDIEAPVADYWPEFSQNGKEKIPVRQILNHQAGLTGVSQPLPQGTYYDWDKTVQVLAEQKPWWEPGTKHGYHAFSFGFLVGELVRRISGMSLGTYFKTHFAEPLSVDFKIGLDEKDFSRTGEIIPDLPPQLDDMEEELVKWFKDLMDPTTITGAAMNNPLMLDFTELNTGNWRRAEIPASNGHCTAMSLARLYGTLSRGGELDGVRILGQSTIERAYQEESCGFDQVLPPFPTRFGLGFMLNYESIPMGPNPKTFGHAGMGGSLGFADPDAKVGFGYVKNKMIGATEGGLLVGANAIKLTDRLYELL